MLENILIKYFGLEKNWNDYDWINAYNKLVDLIYDLGDLGVLPTNERIVDELDKINNEESEEE